VIPAFRYWREDERQDAIQEAVAQAFAAFVVLMRRRRPELIYPTVLARYAIGRVRQGRRLGSRRNSCEPLSRFAQCRRGFAVERLHGSSTDPRDWREAIVEDLHTPVVDQVWFRIDFPDWLSRLSPRNRRIAESLAVGDSTMAVARKYRVSPGRISQLRRELHASWEQFHEGVAAVARREARQSRLAMDCKATVITIPVPWMACDHRID
jgi:hypothetical protein